MLEKKEVNSVESTQQRKLDLKKDRTKQWIWIKEKKMKDWKNKCLNAIGRIQVELYAEAYGEKTDIWKLYAVARQYYTEH